MVKNILTALTSLVVGTTTIVNVGLQQLNSSSGEKVSQNSIEGYGVNAVKITVKLENGVVIETITFYNAFVSLGDMLASDSYFFGLNETSFGRLLIIIDECETYFNKNY